MLVGKLVYHSVDNKGNKRDYHYNLKGVDTSSVTSFKISSAAFDAQQILVAEEYNEDGTVKEQIDAMEERQFTIGMADVKVQATRYKNENGKNVNRPVNRDFFCRLGSLIRYAKQQCTVMNQEGYTGLKLASGEFEAVAEQTYIIPYPCQPNSTFAKVELSFGELYGMMFATDYFELELEEDEGLELELFPNIKNATKLGVAFNTEYLGFPLPEQIVETEPDSTGMYTCLDDIIKAHPDKEFSWLLGKDYRIVDDEHLQEICDYIMNYDGYVYYDTETTGLNITFKSRTGQADQLVGVVLSVKYGESFYFPLQMKSIKNLCGGDHFYVMQHYLKPILEGKKLVAHNMSYDWKVAYIYDINANIVHDTMAIIKLTIGAEKMDYPIGLKYNARVLLNRDSLELSDLIVGDSWGESDIKFWDLPYELVRLYACADTDNTNGLLQYAIQQDLLTKYNAHKVYEIEVAFSYATAYQEFYGHRINIENLGVIKKEIEQQQKEAMAEMEKICGHSFNANSSQQLQTIMFQELHIPPQVSSKTGNLTTDKKTIKKLAELEDIDGNIRYPFCKWLQEYRVAEGVRKIIDKFPEHMTEDGYVFSHVMQYGTTTGRVSVNTPNYQSYSDPVKKNVIPRPGYWMFDTDYSSVEYRVLANMVGNKRIMDSFKDPDFDYHQYQAARMYRVPYNTVDKKKRKAAKGINFGLPYGMGDMSLGETVFGERTKENARKAAVLRSAYFDGQEDIRDWFEQHRSHGVKFGWAATYFGRRRYFHKQIFNEAAIRRQAGNCVIQGTAADIYKMAVGRVFKRVCKEGWLGKVLFSGFIHDELLGEVSNDINPGVFLKALREEFEVKIKNPDGTPWCPLYMGFGYGMSWYEAKSVELPIKLQWEFVEKYGETGFPDWDGNGRKFCDTIPDRLREFDVRDIRNQLYDKDSQGKEIKATLNKQILDCLSDDAKLYTSGIKEYLAEHNAENVDISEYLKENETDIEQYLDKKHHIQKLYSVDGNFVDSFDKGVTESGKTIFIGKVNGKEVCSFEPDNMDTQKAIDMYCVLHDTDRTKVNILSIAKVVKDAEDIDTSNLDLSLEYYDDEDEGERWKEVLNRVKVLGLYPDVENKRVYLLRNVPDVYINTIATKINKTGNGYKISFIMFDEKGNDTVIETASYLPVDEQGFIRQIYIQALQ